MKSDIVRKFSFTGSTAVGKLLMKQAADTVKKISSELGGNAPFIVFDDADLDAAVDAAIASKFRNAGQTCICANRIFVQDGIYDAFATKFTDAVAKMSVGNALEGEKDLGPLINDKAVQPAHRGRCRGAGRLPAPARGGGRRRGGAAGTRPATAADGGDHAADLAGVFLRLLRGPAGRGHPVPIYPPARPAQIEEHVRRRIRHPRQCRGGHPRHRAEYMPVARLLEAGVPGLRRVVTVAGLTADSRRHRWRCGPTTSPSSSTPRVARATPRAWC